mgnify:CR=1 FL=1
MTFKPNLKKRILATLFDYGIVFLATWSYIFVFGEDDGNGAQVINGFPALAVPLFWLLYFVIIEGTCGATFGHQIFKLSVKSLDGKPLSLKQSLKRRLIDPFEFFFFGIPAIIVIKNSEKHQRVGDMWAKTVVVENETKG